ncbi:MAG: hypothetical protein Q4F31_04735, partial [Eubacteriales bacterium]|nr:hypothetical protein [Eubacteriales bacterium]
MRKIIRKINTSIYLKMLRIMLLCSIIPLLLLSIITYKHFYDRAQENAISTVKAINNQFSINVNNRMEQIESLSEAISYYVYNLYTAPVEDLTRYLEVYSASRAEIESISNANRILKIILFLPSDKMLSEKGNRIDILSFNDLESFNMSTEEALNKEKISFWKSNCNQKFAPALTSQKYNVLGYWNISRNLELKTLNYAYVVLIDLDEFSNFLSIDSPYKGKSFLVDGSNTILASSENEVIGLSFDKTKYFQTTLLPDVYQTEGELCVVNNISKNDEYYIFSIIDRMEMKNEVMTLSVYILIAAFVICAFAIIFSLTLSYKFTDRINRMSNVIKTTQGTHDREILNELNDLRNKPDELKDEIDQLADTYCTMLV